MYKCPEFTEEHLSDETEDEISEKEPIFDDIPDEKNTTEVPSNGKGSWSSSKEETQFTPLQQSRIVQMLNSVTSSLMAVTKPVCALSNKVKILKSYLENL